MELFYESMTMTVGDGIKVPFWYAPWLQGREPKDIAPRFFCHFEKEKFEHQFDFPRSCLGFQN